MNISYLQKDICKHKSLYTVEVDTAKSVLKQLWAWREEGVSLLDKLEKCMELLEFPFDQMDV